MSQFEVELPAGGKLKLDNIEEVDLWQQSARRYVSDYGLSKANDLVLLGVILSQQLAIYRAQQDLSDPKKAGAAQSTIAKCAEQITALEKALGIDKRSREAGGQHTTADYITRLKRAAHAKGVHISERVKAYEALAMEARTKIRVLRNADDEDRAYHGISEDAIIDWLEQQLQILEERDKTWAREQGAVFVGKL